MKRPIIMQFAYHTSLKQIADLGKSITWIWYNITEPCNRNTILL